MFLFRSIRNSFCLAVLKTKTGKSSHRNNIIDKQAQMLVNVIVIIK